LSQQRFSAFRARNSFVPRIPTGGRGFNLAGTAPASALLDLYSQIRTALPATWLHDEATTLHSAESFAAAIVDMRT
jgi:hypothetical protein